MSQGSENSNYLLLNYESSEWAVAPSAERRALPCHHEELVYLFVGERTLGVPQLLLQLGLVPVIWLPCRTQRGKSRHKAWKPGLIYNRWFSHQSRFVDD